jgi:hypothetical protein
MFPMTALSLAKLSCTLALDLNVGGEDAHQSVS